MSLHCWLTITLFGNVGCKPNIDPSQRSDTCPPPPDSSPNVAGSRALAILALAALFAVALSTISMPGDNATAQVADASTDVEKRAKAWWGVLTAEERVNVLLGKGFDADTQTDGRQLDDGDPDTDDAGALAQRNYDQLSANNKTGVNEFVDGNSSGVFGDIYAVGDHFGGGIQGIRKFQSVKLWWNHLSCLEARAAVGEDRDTPSDNFDHDGVTTNDNILEPSSVCEFDSDADVGGETDTAELIPYASLGSTAKAQADEVGNALLALTNGGTYSEDDNAIAKRWWNALHVPFLLTTSFELKVQALYGDDAGLSIADETTITAKAQKVYDDLDAGTKALVNDRAMLIYGNGGSGGKYEGVDAWWESMGCIEKQIAVGNDNEPVSQTNLNDNNSTNDEFCVGFDSLSKVQNRDGDNPGYYIDGRGASDRERALTVGRALLDLPSIPDVAAWWNNTLIDAQRVNVVYGDDDTAASEADRKAFQKMYADLGTGYVVASGVPSVTTALLTRHRVSTTDFDHDGDDTTTTVAGYAVKDVVDAIATEIFDPPHGLPGAFRRINNSEIVDKDDASILTNVTSNQPDDDNEFDPPYQSVADWWENLDCRTMRLAVGADNDYLTLDTAGGVNQPETSIYCGHLPGAPGVTATNTVSEEVQTRIETVGKALLARSEVGRPSFNKPVTGVPVITGTVQLDSVLTANTDDIADENGTGTFSYQWMRTTNPTVDIPGATNKTYTVQAVDIGARLSVRVSFTDGGRHLETTTSGLSILVIGSLGKIGKIEPAIRNVTVSGGDVVKLFVNVYGVQGILNNELSGVISWSVNGNGIEGSGRELSYTAPNAPGAYTVTATVSDGSCRPADEKIRESACSASFEVRVRRSAPPQPEPAAPANPTGDIPTILTDSDGNNYEVFTPVEGGTFDSGEGYSIVAESGDVPNGEVIGVRMSDDGSASNAGMTHQRYTLAGNIYGIHVVDGTGTTVTSYQLDSAAQVCLPLPDALRANISHLAMVAVNADDTLTVLSASVKIGATGTLVCGNVSGLPASVAVGSAGAPDAIPTATPIPTPEPPDTGGGAPPNSSALYLLLILLGATAITGAASLLMLKSPLRRA